MSSSVSLSKAVSLNEGHTCTCTWQVCWFANRLCRKYLCKVVPLCSTDHLTIITCVYSGQRVASSQLLLSRCDSHATCPHIIPHHEIHLCTKTLCHIIFVIWIASKLHRCMCKQYVQDNTHEYFWCSPHSVAIIMRLHGIIFTLLCVCATFVYESPEFSFYMTQSAVNNYIISCCRNWPRKEFSWLQLKLQYVLSAKWW